MPDINVIAENDIMKWISVLVNIVWVLGSPFAAYAFWKKYKDIFDQNTIKSIVIVIITIIIGLALPIYLLVKSSEFDGWLFWFSRILSFIALIEFVGLLIVTFSLGIYMRKMPRPKP
jgi:hypothetical protein